MYRYVLVALLSLLLAGNVYSQDRKAKASEITNKLSFMKKGYDKRQIVFRDDSIYGTPFTKVIMKRNIGKDSLRHLLVDNGFYDFNFEQFEFKIKNLAELNEGFIKKNNPKLSKMLSDSTYNMITYSFLDSEDGITVSTLCSENVIIVDSIKEGHVERGPGLDINEITFKAYSKKKNINYYEDELFNNLVRNDGNKGIYILLEDNNRFKITVDAHSKSGRYVIIRDSQGKNLSIVKP